MPVYACQLRRKCAQTRGGFSQWGNSWSPYIANVPFRTVQIVVNKVAFVGFKGGDRQSPPGPAPDIDYYETLTCFLQNCPPNYTAHYISRNVFAYNKRLITMLGPFGALLRNSPHCFIQRCTSSSDFYPITSKLWCFMQIFIFLHYSTLLYDGDQLQ